MSDPQITDEVLAAGAGALEAILGRSCRWEAHTILAAAYPLLRAQIAEEIAAEVLADGAEQMTVERAEARDRQEDQ